MYEQLLSLSHQTNEETRTWRLLLKQPLKMCTVTLSNLYYSTKMSNFRSCGKRNIFREKKGVDIHPRITFHRYLLKVIFHRSIDHSIRILHPEGGLDSPFSSSLPLTVTHPSRTSPRDLLPLGVGRSEQLGPEKILLWKDLPKTSYRGTPKISSTLLFFFIVFFLLPCFYLLLFCVVSLLLYSLRL